MTFHTLWEHACIEITTKSHKASWCGTAPKASPCAEPNSTGYAKGPLPHQPAGEPAEGDKDTSGLKAPGHRAAWAYCETGSVRVLDVTNRCPCRALGTPLDWPEAKKVAGQVREWGIEVVPLVSRLSWHAGLTDEVAIARDMAKSERERARRAAVGR